MTGRKLTGVEQTNTLKALQILRVRVGAWRLLAPLIQHVEYAPLKPYSASFL
jgi:hypothetical protein